MEPERLTPEQAQQAIEEGRYNDAELLDIALDRMIDMAVDQDTHG